MPIQQFALRDKRPGEASSGRDLSPRSDSTLPSTAVLEILIQWLGNKSPTSENRSGHLQLSLCFPAHPGTSEEGFLPEFLADARRDFKTQLLSVLPSQLPALAKDAPLNA